MVTRIFIELINIILPKSFDIYTFIFCLVDIPLLLVSTFIYSILSRKHIIFSNNLIDKFVSGFLDKQFGFLTVSFIHGTLNSFEVMSSIN